MSALPTVSGRGFLLSDGIELQYSKSGLAYARLPLAFSRDRKTDTGWEKDKEIKIDATVFGALAEYLNDQVGGRQEIFVTGDLYSEDWEDKEGKTRTSLKMNVNAAAPVEKRESNGAARRQPVAAASAPANDFPF